MNTPNFIRIAPDRYIYLLELENEVLRKQIADRKHQKTGFGCVRNELTKQMHATGKTLKQWANERGFKYQAVRNVVCGWQNTPTIRAALIAEGFSLSCREEA